MIYLAENLKTFRKSADLTQDEVATAVGVTAQSVSKWERGETTPDIALLPALANLFGTSIDKLMGMEKINSFQAISGIFTAAHRHIQNGNLQSAIAVYEEGLKTYPSDIGIMSDLAMTLALLPDEASLTRAIQLCQRILSGNAPVKVQHTTRAALCFLYQKKGDSERAWQTAGDLPHVRESREVIRELLAQSPDKPEIHRHLRYIILGEPESQS